MTSEDKNRTLPPKLLAIRTSALSLSQTAKAASSEFQFVEGTCIMERKATALVRRSFHQVIPQIAYLLPEIMQLPGMTGRGEKRFFLPQTNEYYTGEDSKNCKNGSHLPLFDPDFREFLGLERIRKLIALHSQSEQPFPNPSLWGFIYDLNFEGESEEPFEPRGGRPPYLSEDDIDDILSKVEYYTVGTPEDSKVDLLKKGVWNIRRDRDRSITSVVNNYGELLKQETIELCRSCAVASDVMPKILRMNLHGLTPVVS